MKGTHLADFPAVGIVMPSETLASLQCDFTEEVWDSSTSGLLAITNWGGAIEQGTTMGTVEKYNLLVRMIQWGVSPDTARFDQLTEDEVSQRKVELEDQLIIGGACSEEECGKFKQLLLCKHSCFALDDAELGETNLVEHVIDKSQ